MKHILTTIIIIVLFSCNSESNTGQRIKNSNKNSIDEFGTNIFDLIKSDNFEELSKYYITKVELDTILHRMRQPSDRSKSEIDSFLNEMTLKFDKEREHFSSGYLELKSKSARKGINWAKCRLEYIDYNIVRFKNLESANIDIFFSIYNNFYEINLYKCYHTDRGWLLGEDIYLSSSNN